MGERIGIIGLILMLLGWFIFINTFILDLTLHLPNATIFGIILTSILVSCFGAILAVLGIIYALWELNKR